MEAEEIPYMWMECTFNSAYKRSINLSGYVIQSASNIDKITTDLSIIEEDNTNMVDDFKSLDDFLSDDKPKEFEDLNYELNMPTSTNVEKSVAIFGRDMKMFDYIAMAMKEFYKNPLYCGDFIEQIIVFENTKTSATFLQYLQSELFVETSSYPINTNHIMNEIMQEEITL